jgi:hypothetical protein
MIKCHMDYQPKSAGIRKRSTVIQNMGLPTKKDSPFFNVISNHNIKQLPEKMQSIFDGGCTNIITAYFSQDDIRTRNFDEVKNMQDLESIKGKIDATLKRGCEIILYPYEGVDYGNTNIGRVSIDLDRLGGYNIAQLNLACSPMPWHQIFNKLGSDGKVD